MRDLQEFIEQNAGKKYGEKYLFENVFIGTRYSRATEPYLVEVILCWPFIEICFSECLDNRIVKNNIEFYKWLTEHFSLMAKESLKRHLNKGD